ncbi:hypothetical protein PENSPDRAFT_98161 [Peniophora sp. CONT]|nr:hypothetical protein PENSPDRAFT_98161 [Peniophora sp. CONT]
MRSPTHTVIFIVHAFTGNKRSSPPLSEFAADIDLSHLADSVPNIHVLEWRPHLQQYRSSGLMCRAAPAYAIEMTTTHKCSSALPTAMYQRTGFRVNGSQPLVFHIGRLERRRHVCYVRVSTTSSMYTLAVSVFPRRASPDATERYALRGAPQRLAGLTRHACSIK